MMRRGFTVVELIITIAIMGILLALAVVNLNSTQATARDNERKTDAENIALQLESFYANINPSIANSGGSYPGTSALQRTVASINSQLPDLDIKNMYSPSKDETGDTSLVVATSTSKPYEPTSLDQYEDLYIYQPLTANNTLCVTPAPGNECRKFNLYYFQEKGPMQVITSKRQ